MVSIHTFTNVVQKCSNNQKIWALHAPPQLSGTDCRLNKVPIHCIGVIGIALWSIANVAPLWDDLVEKAMVV
jgi:hypothetical protein